MLATRACRQPPKIALKADARLLRLQIPANATLRSRMIFRGAATASTTPTSKVWASADEAVKDVKSGSTILCGGTLSFLVRYVCG